MFGVTGVCALSQDGYFKSLGAFAGADHFVVGGLSNHQVFARGDLIADLFGSVGSCLLTRYEQKAKVGAARFFEFDASGVHGINLSFRVAASSSKDPKLVVCLGDNSGRNEGGYGVQMGAKNNAGLPPAKIEI